MLAMMLQTLRSKERLQRPRHREHSSNYHGPQRTLPFPAFSSLRLVLSDFSKLSKQVGNRLCVR